MRLRLGSGSGLGVGGWGFRVGGGGWRWRWRWRWGWRWVPRRAREAGKRLPQSEGCGAGGGAGGVARWLARGSSSAPQHELLQPGRFFGRERLGSQRLRGSSLRAGAVDDPVVDAPRHAAPGRQVELPLLEGGQLVERRAARRGRELAEFERRKERERDFQLHLARLHHAVGAMRVLPAALGPEPGGIARGAARFAPQLRLKYLRGSGGDQGEIGGRSGEIRGDQGEIREDQRRSGGDQGGDQGEIRGQWRPRHWRQRRGCGLGPGRGNGWLRMGGLRRGGLRGELTAPNTEPSPQTARKTITTKTASKFSVRAITTTGHSVRMSSQRFGWTWRRDAGQSEEG